MFILKDMIFFTLLLFLISLAIVTKGADLFVDSAVAISEKRGIPKIIIGATIVSFATTTPEFSVSASAALMNHTDMTIGNAVGSVICNIGIILGILFLIKEVSIDKNVLLKKGIFMIIGAIALLILSLDGVISPIDGIILIMVLVAFLYYNYKLQSSIIKENNDIIIIPLSQMRKELLYFILGAILVVIGSRFMVSTGVDLAHYLGLPEIIISLTLIAFGTSLPEFITALSSISKGHQDLSIGNIIGANIMDITMILGVCSFIYPLPISSQLMNYDFPVMIIFCIMLIVLGITKQKFERWEGGLILTAYILYVAGLFMFYI